MGDVFGLIAAVTSIIGVTPQIYKTMITKSAADISLLMMSNFLLCSVAWVVHASYTGDVFVLYSNVFGIVFCTTSIAQKLYYDSKNKR